MNKWLFVDWVIRQKTRFQEGAKWLPDWVLLAGVLFQAWWIFPIRYIIGTILIWKQIPQRENEIVLQWINPYMDEKLNARRRT